MKHSVAVFRFANFVKSEKMDCMGETTSSASYELLTETEERFIDFVGQHTSVLSPEVEPPGSLKLGEYELVGGVLDFPADSVLFCTEQTGDSPEFYLRRIRFLVRNKLALSVEYSQGGYTQLPGEIWTTFGENGVGDRADDAHIERLLSRLRELELAGSMKLID